MLPVDGPLSLLGTPSWVAPEVTGIGRLPSRAPLVPFPDADAARRHEGDPTASPWVRSLDGTWDFRLRTRPDDVTSADIGADIGAAPDDEGWEPITVPGTWNTQGWGTPHYTNVLMPFGTEPPQVPARDNPTGVYRTTFSLPTAWKGRRTLLHIGGADSIHHVFVNGAAVGMGTDTRLASEYDITPHLRRGRNTLAVVVVRWSANTWVEDQDQWWLSGITRSVRLQSVGQVHLLHARAHGGLADDLTTGTLELEAHVRFASTPEPGWAVTARLETLAGRGVRGRCVLADDSPGPFMPGRPGIQPGQLDGDGRVDMGDLRACDLAGPVPVLDRSSWGATAADGNLFPGHRVRWRMEVPQVLPWSAETPTRYRVVLSLVDPQGVVQEVATQLVGFRSIRIAGRELLVNGRPVLIQGVNRHDHDPTTGCVMSRQSMRDDLVAMKRHNINAVRMSHYPPDPYVLDVADELGLYVIDETNVEAHARYRSLVHDPRFLSALIERLARMVRRDENHPSVIAWSLGNETGYGPAHDAMAAWARAYDPSRFVHYEGPHRYDLGLHGRTATDVVCPMYASIAAIEAWATKAVTSGEDRPLILCEYSHAMGNSNGSLADYDRAFRAHHGLQGGFIWEWIDHGLHATAPNGRPVFAFGGFYGEEPNDGAFVADGLMGPDRTPHPGLIEAMHVWRPVRVSAASAGGRVRIDNDRWFTGLQDLRATWELSADGVVVQRGVLEPVDVAPQQGAAVRVPYDRAKLAGATEGHLVVRWALRRATAWAPAGHVVAWDQVEVDVPAPSRAASRSLTRSVANDAADASATIDPDTGTLLSLTLDGRELLAEPSGFTLWRARIDNDGVPDGELGLPGIGRIWTKWGLEEAVTTVVSSRRSDGGIVTTSHIVGAHTDTASPVVHRQHVKVHTALDGRLSVAFRHDVQVPGALGDLPRLGTRLVLVPGAEQLQWFGRGPLETYADRHQSQLVGHWTSTVTDQYVDYVHPQDHGHHADTRWAEVGWDDGSFVRVRSGEPATFSFAARHHDDRDLHHAHTTADLDPRPETFVWVDHLLRGVGVGSCGPDTLGAYRIGPGRYRWSWDLVVGSRR